MTDICLSVSFRAKRDSQQSSGGDSFASFTHNVCAERVEGICATGIQVGCVQPLQKLDMVVTLCLQKRKGGCHLHKSPDNGMFISYRHKQVRSAGRETKRQRLVEHIPCCFCPFSGSLPASQERLPNQSTKLNTKQDHYSLGHPSPGNSGGA